MKAHLSHRAATILIERTVLTLSNNASQSFRQGPAQYNELQTSSVVESFRKEALIMYSNSRSDNAFSTLSVTAEVLNIVANGPLDV